MKFWLRGSHGLRGGGEFPESFRDWGFVRAPPSCCQVQRRLLMFKVLMRSSLIYVKIMANVITQYNIHFYWEICFPNDARNCYTMYMTKDARIKYHNRALFSKVLEGILIMGFCKKIKDSSNLSQKAVVC